MTFEDSLTFDKFWDDLSDHGSETIEKVSHYFRPSNRSSTIFPVFLSEDVNPYVSFFTYWLKKHGCVVALKAIARDLKGNIVHTFWQPFTSITAERINLRSLPYFNELNGGGFCGTIELEFYTKTQPLFRYPAVSMFYESKKHVAVVHGCIRSYNLDETPADYAIPLPQTGFDINLGPTFKNYVCFVAGRTAHYNLKLTLRSDKSVDVKTVQIEKSVYGQLHLLILEDIFSDRSLNGLVRCTIDHDLDVFPRFYAGTLTNDSYPTLTHSFFDTSEQALLEYGFSGEQKRAKNIESDNYYDSAFIVPVLSASEFGTDIQTYGQNLSFLGEIDIRVLRSDGSVFSEEVQSVPLVSKWNEMHTFSINALLNRCCLADSPASVFFGFRSHGAAFPSRFKLGLNVAKLRKSKFGANICFAPSVQDGTLMDKPISRRWFPIGGPSNFIGTVHLTSFEIAPQRVSKEISVEFYNHRGQRLDRSLTTNNNGTLYFNSLEDDELSRFFDGAMGWCFVSCAAYLLDSYFFATGVDLVGGDHAF